ncbi:MAG: glycoside hydrolase family 27 protein [Roseburia sp.]|nr:glycoside hydrolase family 27 protein [Roseburia sp.]MCM1098407.1 glycoside hydrolase family 27 protein [Ruminococcus flavefaciens]
MDKNKFALTPPMGWNSYDYYDTTVNEEQVKANADYMARHLKEYGWQYIVVDIQWYAHGAGSRRDTYQYIPFSTLEMDEFGRLQPDPERFPSSAGGAGFGPLADYIHSLGLKFGIHIMRGIPRIAAHRHMPVKGTEATADVIANPSSICGWNPDMYGVRDMAAGQAYYDSLLELYAQWGVDYIKCDDICNTNLYPKNPYSARHEVEMLAAAIGKCGREIVLSLSPGPALIEEAWHYETYANMWRITDDFWDDWKLLKDMFRRCELWQRHVSEGCYPDCDMLPLGQLGKGFGRERTTNFTKEEQKTMMTLWCLFGSPLMIGAELTKLDPETLKLLTNRRVLEMRKPSCKPTQLCRDEKKAVWKACDESSGAVYVALFNLGEETCELSVDAESAGIHTDEALTELWTGESVKAAEGRLRTEVPAHGCLVFRRIVHQI